MYNNTLVSTSPEYTPLRVRDSRAGRGIIRSRDYLIRQETLDRFYLLRVARHKYLQLPISHLPMTRQPSQTAVSSSSTLWATGLSVFSSLSLFLLTALSISLEGLGHTRKTKAWQKT